MQQRYVARALFAVITLALMAATSQAQPLRLQETLFFNVGAGLSNYLGDNEKSPFNGGSWRGPALRTGQRDADKQPAFLQRGADLQRS